MITLLLSQWGVIDHSFHEHVAGEVCDYCISAKSFDDAITSTEQKFVAHKANQNPVVLLKTADTKTTSYFYSVRAPPRLI